MAVAPTRPAACSKKGWRNFIAKRPCRWFPGLPGLSGIPQPAPGPQAEPGRAARLAGGLSVVPHSVGQAAIVLSPGGLPMRGILLTAGLSVLLVAGWREPDGNGGAGNGP